MHSPLARVILTVLGGYLLILLVLLVRDWIQSEYPRPPEKAAIATRVQHPFHHDKALGALQRFHDLPKREKAALRDGLAGALMSMDQWLARLAGSGFQVVCLGELHEEATRRFLAETFFARYRIDLLLLEATPPEVEGLIGRMNAGRAYFPLLDADIMGVLRSAKARNAAIEIAGIEETEAQQGEHPAHAGSRDQAIAHNFWREFRPGKRHVVLFGALHCADETHWLFGNLKGLATPALQKRLLNVRVLEEHQNGPMEAFVFFLDEIGIAAPSFVIAEPSRLPPIIYAWFPLLKARLMDTYRVVIVFRDSGRQ